MIPALIGAALVAAVSGEDVARLTQYLKLTPEQVAASTAFQSVMFPPAPPPFDRKAYNALTTPQRARFVARLAAQDAADFENRTRVTEAFYAVLTPDQRSRLDQLTARKEGASAVAADPVPPAELAEFSAKLTRAPSTQEPTWLIRPDGDVIARIYPKAALDHGVKGRAVLRCDTDLEGYLSDCIVVEEQPKGKGFGNAALEATGYMRMTPAMARGTPIHGVVTVPITFHNEGAPPS